MNLQTEKAKRFDYKWVIVALCFLMVSICLGFCSSTKPLYLSAITDALNIPRSLFSVNDSLRFIATAITNLFFGAMIMKLGPKKMILTGLLGLIGSCFFYSIADNIYVFYIGGILLGFGLSMTTTTMVGYVVSVWCKEHKGTIMGLILCANGLGGAIAMQILSPIIYTDDPFSYRRSYYLVILILTVLAVLVAIFFRNTPSKETKLHAVEKKKAKAGTWTGITLKEAMRKPYFYIALVCIALTGMCLQGYGTWQAHAKDIGMLPEYVANVASVASLFLAVFKFSTGFICDKKGLRFTMLLCDGAAIASFLLLAFLSDSLLGRILVVIFAILRSAALPLETIMLPLVTADMFGEKDYAKILGIVVSVNTAGYAVGSPLANYIYDIAGTYSPIFYAFGVVMVTVSVLFMVALNMAKKDREAA